MARRRRKPTTAKGKGFGSVAAELRARQHDDFSILFSPYVTRAEFIRVGSPRAGFGFVRNRRMISDESRTVINAAYHELTGIELHVNRYYFPDAMSEALEAAEALGL